MAIQERDMGGEGLTYLKEYLRRGPAGLPLADCLLRRAVRDEGRVTALLPAECDDETALLFGSARGLHPPYRNVSLEDWTRTMTSPSYTSVEQAFEVAARLIARMLGIQDGTFFVCQRDVRFYERSAVADAVRIDVGGREAMLLEGTQTPHDVYALLKETYAMGTFVAEIVRGRPSRTLSAEALTNDTVLALIEAYDGESFLFWRPAGT